MVVEVDTVACQTWIEGTFNHAFVASPARLLSPNGTRITMDLINIFRFDPEGRLIAEFIHTDYRSLLRQLGVEGA